MKLSEVVEKLLHHQAEKPEMFLSLFIESDYVQGALWQVSGGKTQIEATDTEEVAADSWEERIISADKVIGKLEEKGPGFELTKVVLGLPANFLTEAGDIKTEIRPEIKKLTKELQLTPIGFVSDHQALIHKLKLDEGVPPSVILVHVGATGLTVSLYKIGTLMGQKTINKENAVSEIEDFLKSFKDLEVLPSRILLYGVADKELEEVKLTLMKHPWPTRANFLHFPKIDILPQDSSVIAVSLAGASEMSKALGEEAAEGPTAPAEKVIAQPEIPGGEKEEPETEPSEAAPLEESNVEMVPPETLGFKKGQDILEAQNQKPETEEEEEIEEAKGEEEVKALETKAKLTIPRIPLKLPAFELASLISKFRSVAFRGIPVPFIGLVLLLIIFIAGFNWFVPHATVTILELTKPVDESATVTIDPTATVAESNSKIIPGQKQEQSGSGEKVIATTGTKQVGDPAKGAVTIYNKDTTSSKTIPKGSVLIVGSLNFTLDSDASVASASDPITPGKATANITAAQIGSSSNLPAGTWFNFQDYSNSIVVARNDQPLSGGSSRSITVVSRADYDALVKSLTDDLVQKAKSELGASVSGHQKLIDDTIKATVTAKNFTEELDQESKQLHGKITVTVTGMSYNADDVTTLMKGIVNGKLPSGYTFAPTETTIKLTNVQVKKDGTVVASVQFHAMAVPTFDLDVIKKALAGKSLKQAQDYLRNLTGVGGVEFGFRWTLFKNSLPANKNNISITVAIQN